MMRISLFQIFDMYYMFNFTHKLFVGYLYAYIYIYITDILIKTIFIIDMINIIGDNLLILNI